MEIEIENAINREHEKMDVHVGLPSFWSLLAPNQCLYPHLWCSNLFLRKDHCCTVVVIVVESTS